MADAGRPRLAWHRMRVRAGVAVPALVVAVALVSLAVGVRPGSGEYMGAVVLLLMGALVAAEQARVFHRHPEWREAYPRSERLGRWATPVLIALALVALYFEWRLRW